MNPTAKQTIQVLLAILKQGEITQKQKDFTQYDIAYNLWKLLNKDNKDAVKISGPQISRVMTWLTRQWYITPTRRTNQGGGRIHYRLVNPLGILELIASHRSMPTIRTEFRVNAKGSDLFKFIESRNVLFCLGTALEHYSGYYRPGEISFYAGRDDELREYLMSRPGNLFTVGWYRYDPSDWIIKNKNGKYTSDVQTVVDMFCDGKGYYTKELLDRLWGVKIA